MSPVSGCVFSGKGLRDDPVPHPEESLIRPRKKELLFVNFNKKFYFEMELFPICCFTMYYI